MRIPHIPIRALIKKIEKQAIYEVEPEIIEWAKWQAGLWLERYKRNPRGHYLELEAFNDTVALIGEKIVDATLEQFDIDHTWADPLFPRDDPRAKRPWDFKINAFGSIEVKTTPPIKGHRRALVRCDTYQGADYVLAQKLFPEIRRKVVNRMAKIQDQAAALDAAYDLLKAVNRAVMYGWLTREQVKSLPIGNFGKADCWWTFLEGDESKGVVSKLRPMCEFFDMLLKTRGARGGRG